MTWTTRRGALLAAVSFASLTFANGVAHAQGGGQSGGGVDLDAARPMDGLDLSSVEGIDAFSNTQTLRPDFVIDETVIVPRNELSPNQFPPAGIYDPVNINGVGQMVVANNTVTPGASLGTCTGTLINPRTVIFAAHCVNTRAASAYGSNTGGTPISFGFQQNNLPGLRAWLGFNDPSKLWATDTSLAIYNAEHVWYDPRSKDPISCTNATSCFLQADVAIATLDTPAFGIPTWAMLFSPLDGQEHVTVTGYGSTGNGTVGSNTSGGWRRRVAENYVSFLGSLMDRNVALYTNPGTNPLQNLYMSSFTSPQGWNPAGGSYDFGIFGDADSVLPREGITGPGDSGGPLILDEKFEQKLVIGVLSGGSRFFTAQPSGSYGTHSFYQPLHVYWDTIVANNPYVYATNKAGNGEWTDAGHWIQAMDPSYQIIVDGKLVNSLPSTAGEGPSGSGAKFGEICFLGDCVGYSQAAAAETGNALFVPGGPGSENFVPNNITANPGQGIKPRYYDVTLSAKGTTTLRNASITVDLLTLDGLSRLDVAKGASLRSLGEFNQVAGWTHVDGLMRASEAFFLTGYLTGSGTLQAPWVTTVATAIAPGGADKVGTLTIDGNLVMASGSALFIDASRDGADKLAVTGLLSLSDPNDPASKGPSIVFGKNGAAPRHGQSFTIATAGGGIEGKFGTTYSFQGVLRPELVYGANSITAELRAGALVEIIDETNITANAFAAALDQLRSGSYNALYNLYGMVDLMDGASLTMMLDGLAPRLGTGSQSLQQRQSRMLSGSVNDRLSIMAGAQDGGMSMVGAPETLRMGLTALTGQRNVRMGIADLTPDSRMAMKLPEGFAGFVSGGVFGGRDGASSNLADGGHTGSYFGMGVERAVADDASFGFAVGYANGRELGSNGLMSAKTTQIAAYGAHRLGAKAYVGGVATLENVDLDTQRAGFDGLVDQRLFGASGMTRYAANAEIGVNLPFGQGMTLTPRAQLGYDRTSLGGYTEQGSQVALRIDGLTTQSLTARTGFKLAGSHTSLDGWKVTPQLRADYVRRVAGGNDGMSVRFAAADQIAIALPLAQGDTSWAELRGGVTVEKDNFSFGAGFDTAVARQGLEDNRAMVEFGMRF